MIVDSDYKKCLAFHAELLYYYFILLCSRAYARLCVYRVLMTVDVSQPQSRFTAFADKLFTSPLSILIIALGTVLAWYFENFYIAIGVYGAMFVLIALTCSSLIGTVPVFLYAVTSYSVKMKFDWDLIVPLLITGGSLLLLIIVSTIVFLIKNKVKFRDCKVNLIGFFAMVLVSFTGGILIGYPSTYTYQYLAGIGANLAIMLYVFALSASIKKNNVRFLVHSYIMLAIVVFTETIIYFVRIAVDGGDVMHAFLYKTLSYGWNHSNGGAILMLSALPFALYMIASDRGNPVYYLFISMIIVLGILITQSRATMVALAVVILIGMPIAFFKCNKKRKVEFLQGVLVCIITLAILYLAFADTVVDAIIERFVNKKLDPSGRVEIWQNTLQEVLDGDIIFGMGFLHQLPETTEYCAHSTPLQIFNNFGIVGLVAGAVYYFFLYKTLLYKTGLFGFYATLSMLAFDIFGLLDISMYAPMAVLPMATLVVIGGLAGADRDEEVRKKRLDDFLELAERTVKENRRKAFFAAERNIKSQITSGKGSDSDIPQIKF